MRRFSEFCNHYRRRSAKIWRRSPHNLLSDSRSIEIYLQGDLTNNSVFSKIANMNSVYKALADPTRRKILELLRDRDLSAGEIAAHFDLAKPTLSGHFAVLKAADLIQADKVGTTILYHLNVSVLEETLLSLMNTFNLSTSHPPSSDNAHE
jgi:ArsR family transcriptional regulator, arsenate/arsenite/antimonite-responsive transcriptional repressor